MNRFWMSLVAGSIFMAGEVGASPVATPVSQESADWPQWLGPQRDGRSTEVGIIGDWRTQPPTTVWQRPLGAGFSGISVVGDRIFTMFSTTTREFVVCLAATDGRELWRRDIGAPFPDTQGGPGPRSTPTVSDGSVFTLGSNGLLVAFATEDGSLRWKRNIIEKDGGRIPRWGYCQSPLVHGDLLYLDTGGSKERGLVAYDIKTGNKQWSSGEYRPGYSAPIFTTLDDTPQVLFFTASSLVSVIPTTGRLLWEIPWPTRYGVNAATPVVLPGDRVFVSSGYGTGAAVFRIRAEDERFTAIPIWRNRRMKNKMTTSIAHGEHIYGFNEDRLVCLDLETGHRAWSHADLGRGNLLYAEGHLLVLTEDGALVLVEASPRSYVEKGRIQVLSGTAWTVPSLSAGRVYLRDTESIVCMDLSSGDGTATAP